MLNGYGLIGLCVTKIQDEFCSEFLQSLHGEALKADYRLLVFNSFTDFFCGDKYEQGAGSVYKTINFDVIDALVIIDHCFYDKQIVTKLIEKAKSKNIPVVVLYGSYDGCFSIIKNYTDIFKELISHVINVHGARRLYFIAGTKNEPNSNLRLECFRSVMEENGLEIPEYGVQYCDYWNIPVYNAVDKWVNDGKVPQAVICANDSMAAMVCDRFAHHGIKVPDDVIVTGFDGLSSLNYHSPRLTTCKQEIAETSRLCFEMIRGAVENSAEPFTAEEHFSITLSESCGCHFETDISYRERADKLFRMLEEIRAHEAMIYTWADRIHDSTELSVIGSNLAKNILPGSAVCINSNLLSAARKNENTDSERPFTPKMVVIANRDMNYKLHGQEAFDLNEMYPRLSGCVSEKVMFIFQSIYAADEVCGYYTAKISDIESEAAKLHRLCRLINLDFSVILSRVKQEHMTTRIEKLRTRDALTGLLNLKGLIAAINQNYEEYSKNSIAVSVYAIPRYKYIIENFGLDDADEAVNLTAESLQLANPNSSLISRISEDEFIIVNLIDDPANVGSTIDHATSTFFKIIEDYNRNRDKNYFVEVNCGCVVSMPGWERDIMSFIKAANGEMYLNRLKSGNTPALKKEKTKEEYYRSFDLLIEKNLFIYHFQPIVSARTGRIYAYEALMRTDSSINMNPGQILGVAEEYNRMYDIERATLFNVMGFIDSHTEKFKNRRIFINTIPGCFLKEEDYSLLVEKYGRLFGSCTIEITEQNETNDAELMQIKRFESNGNACQIAIDDYGTGFSNIVNLLRYQPQVIKIDRYLITDVHKDTNKQLFIRSTVEFARLNNILVLAEGVETKEELSKVIELGVDLIQGYYTARPSAEVIQEINADIAGFIASEYTRLFQNASGTYKANDGEILDLFKIRKDGYSSVEFNGGRFIVTGSKVCPVSLTFVTTPDSLNNIAFENINIVSDEPAVVLGENSKNVITLRGDNRIGEANRNCEGIKVPSGAELKLDGYGTLTIISSAVNGVSLGSGANEAYGKITIDMDGILNIDATGEDHVCIGGGICGKNSSISILKGRLNLSSRGVHSVGIGSIEGGAPIKIDSNAEIDIFIKGTEAVAVGSLKGDTDITSDGILNIEMEGKNSVGIGILNDGSGQICIGGKKTSIVTHGSTAACIGSIDGNTDVECHTEMVNIYSEGEKLCGLGNYSGKGSVAVTAGTIRMDMRSPDSFLIGGPNDKTLITEDNVIIENDSAVHK